MAGGQAVVAMTASALEAGLQQAVPVLARTFRDPWWIIGSAAMALAGVPDIVPQDIDVLCSHDDADRLRLRWRMHEAGDSRPRDGMRFRSAFSRYEHLPVPLEAMGGLEVMTADGWRALEVREDIRTVHAGCELRLPTLAEQRRILHLFGRDKDLAKAARLAAFMEEATGVA